MANRIGQLPPIVYFNISDNQTGLFPDGSLIEISDLLAAYKNNPTSAIEEPELFSPGALVDLDPRGLARPRRWENVVAAIILALTGHLPTRQEVLRGRQILQVLPKQLRKFDGLPQLSFCFLPYLLATVKTHLKTTFQADANSINDIIAFINLLSANTPITLTGFLCAHRAYTRPGIHALIEHVDGLKATKALNCLRGIMSNSPWGQTFAVRWYQQGPTEWASSNMFPEMFIAYMVSGQVDEMLRRLANHLNEMQRIAQAASTASCAAYITNLDPITHKTLRFLRDRFGEGWRCADLTSGPHKRDRLVRLANDHTLPSIRRLMPSYSTPRYIIDQHLRRDSYLRRNLPPVSAPYADAELIRSVIDCFYQHQLVQPMARALYETAFYYVWGLSTAETGSAAAFGVDRDHEAFQYHSWCLGYEEVMGSLDGVPLLYARRTAKASLTAGLAGYSVRQFWR